MKKILILKMGDTLKSISQKYGEFPQHIINKINLSVEEFIVVDCQRKEVLPSVDDIKGIIITGSHSMVTDYEPWSVRISNWLKNIINTNIPILGICYGHQLLADILGGEVGYNSKGMEVGESDIYLTKEGQKDKLLGVLPEKFEGYEAHSQSVLKLPSNAKILAYNNHDEIQSFSYENHIWTTQFHPEFISDIVKEYVKINKKNIINIGKDYNEIYNEIEDYKYGEILLNQFIKIIKSYE